MKTNKIGLLFLCFVAAIVLAVMVKDHDKNTAVSEYDHENPYFYTAKQTNTSEDITISENRNVSETESAQVQETEETADWINAIIQQNNARIADHLYNFPAEQKWIDIGLFDFTNDGKEDTVKNKFFIVQTKFVLQILCLRCIHQKANALRCQEFADFGKNGGFVWR